MSLPSNAIYFYVYPSQSQRAAHAPRDVTAGKDVLNRKWIKRSIYHVMIHRKYTEWYLVVKYGMIYYPCTKSEERGVLGVGSIPVAILPSNVNIIAL